MSTNLFSNDPKYSGKPSHKTGGYYNSKKGNEVWTEIFWIRCPQTFGIVYIVIVNKRNIIIVQ